MTIKPFLLREAVLSIDFGKQKIELVNINKEHVVVALEGENSHA